MYDLFDLLLHISGFKLDQTCINQTVSVRGQYEIFITVKLDSLLILLINLTNISNLFLIVDKLE